MHSAARANGATWTHGHEVLFMPLPREHLLRAMTRHAVGYPCAYCGRAFTRDRYQVSLHYAECADCARVATAMDAVVRDAQAGEWGNTKLLVAVGILVAVVMLFTWLVV